VTPQARFAVFDDTDIDFLNQRGMERLIFGAARSDLCPWGLPLAFPPELPRGRRFEDIAMYLHQPAPFLRLNTF